MTDWRPFLNMRPCPDSSLVYCCKNLDCLIATTFEDDITVPSDFRFPMTEYLSVSSLIVLFLSSSSWNLIVIFWVLSFLVLSFRNPKVINDNFYSASYIFRNQHSDYSCQSFFKNEIFHVQNCLNSNLILHFPTWSCPFFHSTSSRVLNFRVSHSF